MMMLRYVSIGCVLLFLGGCSSTDSTFHETWKSTRSLYHTYLNPPAGIDYEDTGNLNDSECNLSQAMHPVDAALTRLERYMRNQDRPPGPEKVQDLLDRFPWVNGVVALSKDCEVMARAPDVSLKEIDFTGMCADEPDRDLRARIAATPLGPEILLGAPIYQGLDFKGYYTVHFDIRMLGESFAQAQAMSIVSPPEVLWRGERSGGAAGARGDWENVIRSSVSGSTSASGDTYYWICRFLGGMPLIFITPQAVQGDVALAETSDAGTMEVAPRTAGQDSGQDSGEDAGSSASADL
jgi:hypothetical protein